MKSAFINPTRGMSRMLPVAIIAGLVALTSGLAAAQPSGDASEIIGPRLFTHAKAKLNLNTSQQTMFDAAASASKSAREQGRANLKPVRDLLQAELAKAAPDFAAVAAAADAARAQNQTLRTQVRSQWLALYATLTPDQVGVVKNLIGQRMAKAATMREKMHDLFMSHHPADGPTGN